MERSLHSPESSCPVGVDPSPFSLVSGFCDCAVCHLEFHINGIIQVCSVLYLFYLSLDIMLLKFTQGVVHITGIPLLLQRSSSLYGQALLYLPIYQIIDIRIVSLLGDLRITAINTMYRFLYGHTFSFLLDKWPKRDCCVIWFMVKYMFSFIRNYQIRCQSGWKTCSVGELYVPTSSTTLGFIGLFHYWPLWWAAFIVVSVCISKITGDFEHFFICCLSFYTLDEVYSCFLPMLRIRFLYYWILRIV